MIAELTISEKIALCAATLDAQQGAFTAEDLVVYCWQRFPETFGLQGYAERFPDSNRVLTNIMGTKGLRGKGWIKKIGEKRYRITEAGRQATLAFGEQSRDSLERRAGSLSRQTIDILERLTNSRALRKFRIGEEVTFSDVCELWNISPRSNANQLRVATREAEAAIEAANRHLSKNGESLALPKGNGSFSRAVVHDLLELQKTIKKRFDRELAVIQTRDDERGQR